MQPHWIADRTKEIQVSGIRKVFDLAANLQDPVNLSIGQPDFPMPAAVKEAAKRAIDRDQNGYTVTQGIGALRERLRADLREQYPGHADRDVFLVSGTSGGLVLALLCTVNPGDEVIFFDPYFVMYPNFVSLAGGKSVILDTYPRFGIDVDQVARAITPRTKAIILNSPANPTGAVLPRATLRDLAHLARDRGVLLISDEIYRLFSYDEPFVSPAEFDENVLVVDGFSKSHAMTGWRLGWVHGPKRILEEMVKFQQFTYVCAPSVAQHAGLAALDCDMSAHVADYRRKRDFLVENLRADFDLEVPGGAFYLFPKAPWGTGTEFVAEAIRNNLLIIPGNVFSRQDTHFRISFAATDQTLERGVEILRKIRKR